MPHPPELEAPEPWTAAELERARAAVAELWPALLEVIRHGHGEIDGYVVGGKLEKWDAVFVKRGQVGKVVQ